MVSHSYNDTRRSVQPLQSWLVLLGKKLYLNQYKTEKLIYYNFIVQEANVVCTQTSVYVKAYTFMYK